ncbi:MAG: hypothetical protein PVH29_04380 [Candidatus Zixiibacteriota bacterium]
MMQYSLLLIAAAAAPLVLTACAGAGDKKPPASCDPIIEPYLVPDGAGIEDVEYLDTLSTGEAEDGALLINGKAAFKSRVWGHELLRAPVTEKECLYYWLEITHETPEANYHLLTDVSDAKIFVYVGNAYVAVDRPRRAEGRPPDYEMTFKSGKEPGTFPVPSHSYPEVTYKLWYLEAGREYDVRVIRYGSAYEAPETGEIIYEASYHFFFE